MGEECAGQRVQPLKGPWGSTVAGMLEEQREGPCGWRRVSEQEKGQVVQGLVGCEKGLGLSPLGRWEPWRTMVRGRMGPDSDAHRCPLVAAGGAQPLGGWW